MLKEKLFVKYYTVELSKYLEVFGKQTNMIVHLYSYMLVALRSIYFFSFSSDPK